VRTRELQVRGSTSSSPASSLTTRSPTPAVSRPAAPRCCAHSRCSRSRIGAPLRGGRLISRPDRIRRWTAGAGLEALPVSGERHHGHLAV